MAEGRIGMADLYPLISNAIVALDKKTSESRSALCVRDLWSVFVLVKLADMVLRVKLKAELGD
jgi:hypothetical protein